MSTKPRSVDDYMSGVAEPQLSVLQALRETIAAAAPGAEQCISYQLPTFRLDGRMLVSFAAWKSHCAIYPLSAATLRAHAAELDGFDTDKGTIRFTPQRPLPAPIVAKLVAARIVENALRAGKV